jgi:hypothetical protein
MELPDPKSQKFKNMIVFAGLIMIAGGIYWLYGPQTVTGKAALDAMSPEQRAIAGRLTALKPGAPLDELNAILGQPMENRDVLVRWKGPVTPEKTRILAQLPDKKLNKLTYMALDLSWSWTIQSDGTRMVVVEDEK